LEFGVVGEVEAELVDVEAEAAVLVADVDVDGMDAEMGGRRRRGWGGGGHARDYKTGRGGAEKDNAEAQGRAEARGGVCAGRSLPEAAKWGTICYVWCADTIAGEKEKGEWGMTARILDGTKIRDAMFGELKDEVAILTSAGIRPGLAAVLVGENPASQMYVKSKIAACEQLGMASGLITPAASATTAEMLAIVEDLNRDNETDGILIQLPLPAQVDTKRVLEAVDPAKDVDGFHPVNLGRLVSGRPGLVACTPAGCMEILRRNEIAIEGANAVVLGRSDIVGKPMALLLMHANATVTICHSKTKNLADVVRGADIVVAAMGKAGFVQADWIKPGAAVIDVGTNRVTDEAEAERLFRNFPARLEKFKAKGNALVGDVHPDAVNVAGALTPVPGGVGPMTITMLMSNTVKAARMRRAKTIPRTIAAGGPSNSGVR
jgi:methylenetetrahydrofolate dehydrogenase (NADP+)/methenyltetrahydrofolate cyclohydrolase